MRKGSIVASDGSRSSSGKSSYSMIPSDMSISNRPVTGAGGVARQIASGRSMPRFESAGYFSNLIQQKTTEILNEMERLQLETEMEDGDARRKLDNDYKLLVRDIQQLEANLADWNLAKDKARSGANCEDIQDETIDILNRNKKLEHAIDEIFVSRKRIDSEALKLKVHVKSMTDAMEQSVSSDPDMLLQYKMLLDEINTIHEEAKTEEDKMTELRTQIKLAEEEYRQSKSSLAKMHVEELERQMEETDLEMELAVLDENEGRRHLLEKVKQIQLKIKQIDKQAGGVQSDIDALIKEQRQLKQTQRNKSCHLEEHVVEQIRQKGEEQKMFLANAHETRALLEDENKRLTDSIAALEKDIDKRKTAPDLKLPTNAELELMQEEVAFTTKQLDTNQDTIARLQQQKRTREMELERVLTLEDKIARELKEIKSKTVAMKLEMDSFKTEDELQAAAMATREQLLEKTEQYTQKIQDIDDLLSKTSSKYEEKKKALESNPNWERYDVLRTKMRDQEQVINELQEELNSMKAKTDYSNLKAECLSLAHKMNEAIIGDKQ